MIIIRLFYCKTTRLFTIITIFVKVSEYASLLTVNIPCSTFFEGPPASGQMSLIFSCVPPLEGRYLSIQKLTFGVLQLDQVIIDPPIGISSFSKS